MFSTVLLANVSYSKRPKMCFSCGIQRRLAAVFTFNLVFHDLDMFGEYRLVNVQVGPLLDLAKVSS